MSHDNARTGASYRAEIERLRRELTILRAANGELDAAAARYRAASAAYAATHGLAVRTAAREAWESAQDDLLEAALAVVREE